MLGQELPAQERPMQKPGDVLRTGAVCRADRKLSVRFVWLKKMRWMYCAFVPSLEQKKKKID